MKDRDKSTGEGATEIVMTPLHIKILLHVYCSPEPYPTAENATVKDYTQELSRVGLIELSRNTAHYECTERGALHVEQLLDLPLPQHAWKMANGEVKYQNVLANVKGVEIV